MSPEIELSSSDLIREFAKYGFGIGTVIRNFVESDFLDGTLFEIKTNPRLLQRRLGVVTLRDFPVSTASQELMKALRR